MSDCGDATTDSCDPSGDAPSCSNNEPANESSSYSCEPANHYEPSAPQLNEAWQENDTTAPPPSYDDVMMGTRVENSKPVITQGINLQIDLIKIIIPSNSTQENIFLKF